MRDALKTVLADTANNPQGDHRYGYRVDMAKFYLMVYVGLVVLALLVYYFKDPGWSPGYLVLIWAGAAGLVANLHYTQELVRLSAPMSEAEFHLYQQLVSSNPDAPIVPLQVESYQLKKAHLENAQTFLREARKQSSKNLPNSSQKNGDTLDEK